MFVESKANLEIKESMYKLTPNVSNLDATQDVSSIVVQDVKVNRKHALPEESAFEEFPKENSSIEDFIGSIRLSEKVHIKFNLYTLDQI